MHKQHILESATQPRYKTGRAYSKTNQERELHYAKEITVNSSRYAVGFYHKLGFTDVEKEQLTDGIRYTPMKYIRQK